MKIALKEKASIVVLDMETPGGELGVTLEIMRNHCHPRAFRRDDHHIRK